MTDERSLPNEDEDAESAIEYAREPYEDEDAGSAIEHARFALSEDDSVPSVLYRMTEGLGLLLNEWRQAERDNPYELGDEMAQSILFRLGALAEQVWLPYHHKVDKTLKAETRARARAIAFLGMECHEQNETEAAESASTDWWDGVGANIRSREVNGEQG